MNGICEHVWTEQEVRDGYVMCVKCDTHKSTRAPDPKTIYTPDYWTHERGHSTIEEQVFNCDAHEEDGKTKNQHIIEQIDVETRDKALEIGCAPGALLGRLKRDSGFDWVTGIDVTEEWRNDIATASGLGEFGNWKYRAGFFPELTQEWLGAQWDLIVGCDVFEHCHEPMAFLNECARLLRTGGQLILMLPLLCDDMPERMWHPEQHVYIYNVMVLIRMLEAAGFTGGVYLTRWCPGHETISVHK